MKVPGSTKELCVLGVGPRPTTFNEMNAQFVQLAGNLQLVLHREGDTRLLGAVSESGIVELNVFQLPGPPETK